MHLTATHTTSHAAAQVPPVEEARPLNGESIFELPPALLLQMDDDLRQA
jgi:ABC-type hemin transport system substrate-binding protein